MVKVHHCRGRHFVVPSFGAALHQSVGATKMAIGSLDGDGNLVMLRTFLRFLDGKKVGMLFVERKILSLFSLKSHKGIDQNRNKMKQEDSQL